MGVDLKKVDMINREINLDENVTIRARDIFVPIPIDNDIDECVRASHFIINSPEAIPKLIGNTLPVKCTSYPLCEVIKVEKLGWNKLISLSEDYVSSCDESFRGSLSYKDAQDNEKSRLTYSGNGVKDDETNIGLNLDCNDLEDLIGWGSLLI